MVDEWVYKQMNAATAITTIVGTAIYPIIRQEESELPAVVYDLIGIEINDTKKIASTVDVWDCDIIAFSETYAQGRTLIEAVRTALDRKTGTQGSTVVDDCWVDGYNQEKIDDTEIFAFTYSFKVRTKR